MKIDIGIDDRSRKDIAGGLSRLLADTYTLYLKTHNFHWNVTGPMFNTLHLMAYAALPDVTREKITGQWAVHSLEFMRESLDNPPPTEAQKRNAPPVSHPIVRPHPETGQTCLYIGMYASHVEDRPVAEGRTILARLQEQSTPPPFVYSHRWQPGDVMIWDNRCLMHRGVSDYAMDRERRVMKRVCVQDPAGQSAGSAGPGLG